jgi:hypothetical protein
MPCDVEGTDDIYSYSAASQGTTKIARNSPEGRMRQDGFLRGVKEHGPVDNTFILDFWSLYYGTIGFCHSVCGTLLR